jgi:hypothetical protein
MFYWIYELPTGQLVLMFSCVFVATSWLGSLFLRPVLRAAVRRHARSNDMVGYVFGAHGAYFGILLGLLALSAYQNYTTADGIVALEASRLAALYRDVSSYPQPARAELQGSLRDYANYVINEAWPLQQRGIIPRGGTDITSRFQTLLTRFEPGSKGEEILHAETLRQFNAFVEARRLRLNAVNAAIPPVLWYTVFIGAAINVVLVWMMDSHVAAQLFVGGLAAIFLGTLVALVAAMDNPFRGEFSVTPDAFRVIVDQLMTPETAGPRP